MAVVIPTFQTVSSKFVQEIVLDGQLFTVRIHWNSRAQYWLLSIADNAGHSLEGRRLVPNWPVTQQSHFLIPTLPGEILCLQTTENVEGIITYDNLNNGWNLFYLTRQEFREWEASYGI